MQVGKIPDRREFLLPAKPARWVPGCTRSSRLSEKTPRQGVPSGTSERRSRRTPAGETVVAKTVSHPGPMAMEVTVLTTPPMGWTSLVMMSTAVTCSTPLSVPTTQGSISHRSLAAFYQQQR